MCILKFIFSSESACRQTTINDLPVGRSVEETVRLVKAFQFTVSILAPLSILLFKLTLPV